MNFVDGIRFVNILSMNICIHPMQGHRRRYGRYGHGRTTFLTASRLFNFQKQCF